MNSDYHNNVMIYMSNLSMYYVTCVVVSMVAIVVSWYFHFKYIPIKESEEITEEKMEEKIEEKIVEEETEEKMEDHVPLLKNTTKEALEQITAGMTEKQLQAEREAEQKQLQAILELLQKQEDKFQVGSIEELEGQLKLYR